MYKVIFYEDRKGNLPIADWIYELEQQATTSKNARINFNKIIIFIDVLESKGTRVGEPVTKYLGGDIWELRPLGNRILYAYYKENTFILLHHFVKNSQKTPQREIEQAKRNLSDFIERNDV